MGSVLNKKIAQEKDQAERTIKGIFDLPDGSVVNGELNLAEERTTLRLFAAKPLKTAESGDFIFGRSTTGEKISLLQCVCISNGFISNLGGTKEYVQVIFPNLVLLGKKNLDLNQEKIGEIEFTSDDLSIMCDSRPQVSYLRDTAPLSVFFSTEFPKMGYTENDKNYDGLLVGWKTEIARLQSCCGELVFLNRPAQKWDFYGNLNFENKTLISLKFRSPVSLNTAISRILEITTFLSVNAGRAQGINEVRVLVKDEVKDWDAKLFVSNRWKLSDIEGVYAPNQSDLPIFISDNQIQSLHVLNKWLELHKSRKVPRTSSLTCLRNVNRYAPERLVLAANMFDLLPKDAFKTKEELSDEIKAKLDESKEAFRCLPNSDARTQVLNALGRIGGVSLTRKILDRTLLVQNNVENIFPELNLVAKHAVKMRNFFVHGSDVNLGSEIWQEQVPFFTDALEFVFSVSDLIDCGWDAYDWFKRSHAGGHSFSRFCDQYNFSLSRLKKNLSQNQ